MFEEHIHPFLEGFALFVVEHVLGLEGLVYGQIYGVVGVGDAGRVTRLAVGLVRHDDHAAVIAVVVDVVVAHVVVLARRHAVPTLVVATPAAASLLDWRRYALVVRLSEARRSESPQLLLEEGETAPGGGGVLAPVRLVLSVVARGWPKTQAFFVHVLRGRCRGRLGAVVRGSERRLEYAQDDVFGAAHDHLARAPVQHFLL